MEGRRRGKRPFLLLSEMGVENYLPDECGRVALLTAYARSRAEDVCARRNYGSWWLRSAVRTGHGAHCLYVYIFVQEEKLLGTITSSMGTGVWSADAGVRPAIWYQP